MAYASRSLKTAERRYPAHKLEFLALKWAVCQKFHDYLYGSKFEAITDNNPLTYIFSTARLDATGQRWVADLSNYNFTITYRSGRNNADADSLSRLHTEEAEPIQDTFPDVLRAVACATSVSVEEAPLMECIALPDSTMPTEEAIPDNLLRGTALTLKDWRCAHQDDQDMSYLIKCIERTHQPDAQHIMDEGGDTRFLRNWKSYVVQEGVLLHKTNIDRHETTQVVIPKSLRETVLRAYHDDLEHQGRDRNRSVMKTRVFWPGMVKDVRTRIRTVVHVSAETAPPRATYLIKVTSSAPMRLVCIYYLTLERDKGGYENILVITDYFSRYAQAFPTRNQTAQTTARVLF